MGFNRGRVALTLSPKGIETIAFVSADKGEALSFYSLITDELNIFEQKIRRLCELAEVEIDEEQR